MENELTHADIIERLDRLEEKLEPIIFAWQDCTAIGRGFRTAGRGILWVAALVVAVMAAWTAVTGVPII